MHWIMARLEFKCSFKKKKQVRPIWCHDYVKVFVRVADIKGWFGLEIHIHLLPEQACIPLQVMAVYKIKEEEK